MHGEGDKFERMVRKKTHQEYISLRYHATPCVMQLISGCAIMNGAVSSGADSSPDKRSAYEDHLAFHGSLVPATISSGDISFQRSKRIAYCSFIVRASKRAHLTCIG